ncbi:unnamed protein product [Ilex paraguariensis]|uniref:Transmembrane protein n=1 Tax=Ilex paraguariensis TaxID=185542 RepID=A0ABC8TPG3_9AQUA
MESSKMVVFVLVVSMVLVATFAPFAFAHCRNELPSSSNGVTVINSRVSLSKIMWEGGVSRNDGCSGSSCNILNDPCCPGCSCLPVALLVGVCVGG